MTEEQFVIELTIRAFKDQVDGYRFGDSRRDGFQPRVVTIKLPDGKLNREATLNLPCYHRFTPEERTAMLA